MTKDNEKIKDKEEFHTLESESGKEIKGIVNNIIEQTPSCDINIENQQDQSDYQNQENQTEHIEIESNSISSYNQFENLTDKKGRNFSSELHKTDDNGLPLLNQDGTAKIKRRKQRNTINQPDIKSIEQDQAEKNKTLSLEQAGQMFAAYTFAFCSGVFGAEFKPKVDETIDENKIISDAYTQYLVAKDIDEMPPNVILIGALSLYLLPRFMEEKVQEKIGSKIKRLYKKIFRRK